MKRAILFALMMAACAPDYRTLPDDIPETQKQIDAITYTHMYAEAAQVKIDRVRFVTFQYQAFAAAWADCRYKDSDPQWITFHAPTLERLGDSDVRLAAAHEVCHVLYGDTRHCGLAGVEQNIENRAAACGRQLSGV